MITRPHSTNVREQLNRFNVCKLTPNANAFQKAETLHSLMHSQCAFGCSQPYIKQLCVSATELSGETMNLSYFARMREHGVIYR